MTRSRRLLAMLAALAVVAVGAVVAWAARDGGGPKPPERPLAEAVSRALHARTGGGVRARFTVRNHLLPAGSVGPPLSGVLDAGAEGRVAIAADGRFRLELDTAAGPLEAAYDGRRLRLFSPLLPVVYETPIDRRDLRLRVPGVLEVAGALARLRRYAVVSSARPASVAGRPAYEVRIDPRDDGGLLGAVELAWDADRGVPLRGAVFAQGEDAPAVEAEVTRVGFGPVAAAELASRAPAGLPRVDLDAAGGARGAGRGSPGVAAALPVPPRTLAGLRRRVLRRGVGAVAGTLAIYGHGLGTVVVLQAPAAAGAGAAGAADLGLPQVNVDGATGAELATAVGTGLSVTRDRVRSVVFGLVPPVAAENVARELVAAGR